MLVTVDDAQWVDESSLEALAFAVRRLTMEPVVVIAAVRGEQRIPLGNGHVAAARRSAASPTTTRARCSSERAGLSGVAADQLLRVAAGNPLALLELPEIVGSVPPPAEGVEPPPVGPRVTAAFRARLDRLPDATRRAVGVVAADGVAGLREFLVAFGSLGLPLDALGPAEHAGPRDDRGRPRRVAPPAAPAGRVPRARVRPSSARVHAALAGRARAAERERAAHLASRRGHARLRRGSCRARSTKSRARR